MATSYNQNLTFFPKNRKLPNKTIIRIIIESTITTPTEPIQNPINKNSPNQTQSPHSLLTSYFRSRLKPHRPRQSRIIPRANCHRFSRTFVYNNMCQIFSCVGRKRAHTHQNSAIAADTRPYLQRDDSTDSYIDTNRASQTKIEKFDCFGSAFGIGGGF